MPLRFPMDLLPIVAPMLNPASIFQFTNLNLKLNPPVLRESLPLTLSCHAEAKLMRAIQKLQKVPCPRSQEFRTRMNQVHHAQRNLLVSFYILHLETDQCYRVSKLYRNILPLQDRQDLQNTYSENVLFAAQAIASGFRIRGIDTSVESLMEDARFLLQNVDLFRNVLRVRASQSILPPYRDLFGALHEFEKAWCSFEEKLCEFYANHLGKGKSLAENMQFFQILMDNSISLALSENYITLEMIEMCDASLMVAIPRLAILMGVKENLDKDGSIDLLNLFEDASVEKIRILSKELCSNQFQILQEMLVNPKSKECDDLKVVEAFKLICGLADNLHSGKQARHFVDTLSRTFTHFGS